MERYNNLDEMLASNHAVQNYFNSLPDYVRETIISRGDNVHTPVELQGYADNLLRGDG